ncbi:RE2, partial [Symbiodinium necroappetens]
AQRLGLAPHPNWTAVELRSAITEVTAETKTTSLPKGLSSMRLQELKDEAMKVGLPIPEKATRGTLMRNIRDYHATPSTTVMTIGKHKGNTYEQVPRTYGLWADAEEKVNGANMHPDLRRYVMWFRRQTNSDLPEQVTTLDKMNNPEKYAVVSLLEGSMKSDTDQSWDEVRSMAAVSKKGYDHEQLPLRPPTSSSSSSSKPTKRPAAKDKGTARMGIEPDPKVLDEIRALETRLATKEDALGAEHPKNQDATENPLGDFMLYNNQEAKDDVTNEPESEDEYMVMLTDHVEGIIKDRLLAKDFSVEALTTILENVFGESGEYLPKRGAMPRRTTFGEEDKGTRRISLGYYSHGGLRGICNKSAEYASFSVYMKHYILHYHPEARWTSMAVSLNNEAKIHGDYHNLRGTLNYLTCAGGFSSGGGLWREVGKGENVPKDQEIVERYTDGGEILRGIVLPAKGEVAKFPGEFRHATEPWEGGSRWSVTCFTTRSFAESTKNEKRRLRQCGYPVPDLRHLTPDRKFIQMRNDTERDKPCRRVLPRYSTRKSLWKAAVRASVFLTWSLASLSSAQALMTTAHEKGVTILEIGDFQQSLAVTEAISADIAEPISWAELKDNNGKQRVLSIISDFLPNVVWINPPKDPAINDGDNHDRGVNDVCTAVDWCAPEQLARKGSLVVEMTYLSEQDSGTIRTKLNEYGEVTEHFFGDTKFYKARLRENHQAHVTEGEDDIHDKEIDDGHLIPQTADDAQRRRESIRSSAKAAFLRVRAEDKIRRGTLQRARVRPRDLPNGEMALFWRKDKNNKKGAWRGPGVVIGRQHENYWIARGGRCFLCAPEHVRQASPEELGGLFALRATREDLQRLIERDHDDEDIFEEGDADEADIEMPTEIADENELQAIIDDLSMDEGHQMEGDAGLLKDAKTETQSLDLYAGVFVKRGRRLIPLDKHELFKAAEESEEVRKNEPDRIIGSRFATAVMCILQITASRLDQQWTLAAGDVTAAFLNGDAMERRLFLQQPKHGLPGLHPSQLIAIRKGVFGLVDSPRKWWRRFRQDIQRREIKLENQKVAKFVNSPLDPCVFQLMELDSAGNVKEDSYPLCYAAVHVDDILLAGPRSLNRLVQEQLSHCFPVEEWETDSFDFIGSHIEVLKDEIRISQGAYVSSRLFQVEVDTKEDGLAMASAEQLADNRSLIGALSWLASQTRPDLACG